MGAQKWAPGVSLAVPDRSSFPQESPGLVPDPSQPPLPCPDVLILDPSRPALVPGGVGVYQEIGKWPPAFWSIGARGPVPVGPDVVRGLVTRALFHNECPSCSAPLQVRANAIYGCSSYDHRAPTHSACVTKIFRPMCPPVGTPFLRVLRQAVAWHTLADEDVVAETCRFLKLGEQTMGYLLHEFGPHQPHTHRHEWVCFLIERQMCWGPGAREDLFALKQRQKQDRARRSSVQRKRRSGTGGRKRKTTERPSSGGDTTETE
jgi:hypothetical protein